MREQGHDEHGNAWSPYSAEGWEPLRCCLRLAEPDEQVVLISYAPSRPRRRWTEVGPVYVHAEACDGYPDGSDLPPQLRTGPRVLRGYDRGHGLCATTTSGSSTRARTWPRRSTSCSSTTTCRPCTCGRCRPSASPTRSRGASRAAPSRRAIAAASVRPLAPSLARMLDTCTLTVLALMNSCLPISPLLRPWATSARISRSRAVSRVVAAVARRCVAARSRPACAARPAAARRAAARRSRGPRSAAVGPPRRVDRSRAGRRRAGPATGPSRRRARTPRTASTASSQARDQLVLRRGVDAAGQPAQPRVLGAHPGHPGLALGTDHLPATQPARRRPPRRPRPARRRGTIIAARSSADIGRGRRRRAGRASAR